MGVAGGRRLRPARKAPALLVTDLVALVGRLGDAGVDVTDDEPLEGYNRVYVDDPFGNRIELMEPAAHPRREAGSPLSEGINEAVDELAGDGAVWSSAGLKMVISRPATRPVPTAVGALSRARSS